MLCVGVLFVSCSSYLFGGGVGVLEVVSVLYMVLVRVQFFVWQGA